MKKIKIICLLFFYVFNSCGKNETIDDPSFFLNLVVSNPAQSLKLSLNIVPHPSSPHSGLLYLHRVQENSNVLDYRETGVLRERMFDSVPLSREIFEDFSFLIREAHVWELGNVIGQRTDGNVYHFMLKDSTRKHTFSVMGMSNNKPLQKLIAFCLEQFYTYYPEISLMAASSEIEIKKYNRLTSKQDSTYIRIIKHENDIKLFIEQRFFSITKSEFVELWRILENNHIWDLSTNTEFAGKYPLEYRLCIKRDSRICNFTVFAPSKLSDKRYFNIINSVETLNPSM